MAQYVTINLKKDVIVMKISEKATQEITRTKKTIST